MINKKITICICSFNNYELLETALTSLTNQSVPMDVYDVLVLDNTPTTVLQTLEYKRCLALCKIHKFKYVHEQTNGLAGARNRCIDLSETELLHFMDDDALAHFDMIQTIIVEFNENPSVGIIGGKVIPNWTRATRPSWLLDEHLGFLSMVDLGPEKVFYGTPGFWIAGANIAFRRDVFLKCGNFDEMFGRKGNSCTLMSQEETDLIKRSSDQFAIMYSPKIKIDHIVMPDRVNQEWFLKRVAWQSVSDVMAGDLWLQRKVGTKQHISQNLNKLLVTSLSDQDFADKLETTRYLVFHALLTGNLKDDNIT